MKDVVKLPIISGVNPNGGGRKDKKTHRKTAEFNAMPVLASDEMAINLKSSNIVKETATSETTRQMSKQQHCWSSMKEQVNCVSSHYNYNNSSSIGSRRRKKGQRIIQESKLTLPTLVEEIYVTDHQNQQQAGGNKTGKNNSNDSLSLNQLHIQSLENRNSMAFWRSKVKEKTVKGNDLNVSLQQTKTSATYLPALNFSNKKKDRF
eukprot:gene19843-21785_t